MSPRFRTRLHSLLDDPALRRRMGAAGRDRYENAFTLDHMLRKTLAVYQWQFSAFLRQHARVSRDAVCRVRASIIDG